MSGQGTDAVAGKRAWWSADVGVLRLTGAERVDLLHRLSTQDLRPLQGPGRTADTLLATVQGKVAAWVRLYSFAECLWLTCAPEVLGTVQSWIDGYIIMEDVGLVPEPATAWAAVHILGADAASCLGMPDAVPHTFGQVDLNAVLAASTTEAAGVSRVSGLSGPAGFSTLGEPPSLAACPVSELSPAYGPGVLLLCPQDALPKLETFFGAPAMPASMAETLRLRAGVPSVQHELATPTNPFEMRLAASTVAWNKGCYIGQEVISRLDSYDKVARLLMGFETDGPLPPMLAAEAKLTQDGRPIGRATSWQSHASGSIGLALVKRQAAQPGPAMLLAGQTQIPVQLSDRPFWMPPA